MKKIIFVNRYFYPDHSATSQLLTDLAFALAREGRDVRVITSRQAYDDPASELPATESVNGVGITRVWTSRFGRGRLWGRAFDYLTFYISAAWRLAAITGTGDIVVAKTDPPLISVIAAAVAKLRKATLVNWIQDLFPEIAVALGVKGINLLAPVLRGLRNVSLRAAEFNVVLGDRMAERIIAQGINPEQIKVIHNWADGNDIKPVPRADNRLREEWGLRAKFVVGYSGNMGRAHEFQTIVNVAALLKDSIDLVFLFIGNGARRQWVESECKRRGLSNVAFKPYQPREFLAESLSVPDIHVISLMPALEGLIVPSKFYGIAAAGRPTLYLGDPAGEIPKILAECRCGIAVNIGDAEKAADYIKSMMTDMSEVEMAGASARAVFEKCFDKSRALDVWRSIL